MGRTSYQTVKTNCKKKVLMPSEGQNQAHLQLTELRTFPKSNPIVFVITSLYIIPCKIFGVLQVNHVTD